MRKQILFIQGAGDGAYEEDKKLADSLRRSLGASYEVRYPKMKDEDNAPYDEWTHQLEEELTAMNDPVVLVGHSVGGSILIKFLSDTKIKNNISGIFLIAAPFWGGDGGWTYDGYEQLELPKPSKLSNDARIFLYHGDDDEVVPFKHLKLYSKSFPMATMRELKRRDHQLNNDLAEVANDIKGLF